MRNIRDDHARVALANMEIPHQSQLHQSLAGASLGVAVSHIPASGLVGWPRRDSTLSIFIAAGHWLRAGIKFLASSREVVFLVADHRM